MNTSTIPRTPVDSKMMKSYGYADGHIAVEMHGGAVYHYPATQEQFDAFEASESKGKHFLSHIKPIGHSHKFTPEAQS